MTSQPCNGKSFVETQKKNSTSQWSVILCTFYRQILSLLYSSFFFWNFRHRLARELLVSTCIYTNIYKYIHPQIPRLGRSHQSCLKTPADNGRSLLFWCSTSSINPKTNQIALEIVATKYIAINVQKITMTSCGTLPQEFQNKLCYLG